MKHFMTVGLIVIFFGLSSGAQAKLPAKGAKPAATSAKAPGLPVIPASQISREQAWEYLSLTHRTDVMEKAYKARYVDAKGAKPPTEEMKKRHLAKLNNLLITMVQKSFSPSAMDSVLVFLKTPGGQRWAEDAAEFNDDFRDEINEAWSEFSEEIREANEAAADAKSGVAPAIAPAAAPGASAGSAPMPKATLPPAPAPFGH